MTTALWISLVVGAMAFVGNLVSGYLQRKQMRQLELYRQDPSVGLVPLPHPFTLLLQKYRLAICNTGIAAFFLVSGFRSQEPMTRLSVLNIAVGIGFLFLALTTKMTADLYHFLGRLVGVLEGHSKELAALIGTTGIIADHLKARGTRVARRNDGLLLRRLLRTRMK